jgi:hypothetical protein
MVDPSQGEAELRGGAAALPAASAPPPGFDDAFTRLTLLMCWLCLGYFYGMSPLVLPVAEAFGEDDTVMGGVFLYGSSLMFLVLDLVGGALPLFMPSRPHLYRRLAAAGLLAWGAGLWVQALAVWQRWLPLFFFSFVLLGVGMGIFGLFFLHFELTVRWAHDVARLHAGAGFAIGCGAIVHTLAFGLLTEYAGVARALLGVAAVHSAALCYCWAAGFRWVSFFGKGADRAAMDAAVAATRRRQRAAGGGGAPTPVRELLRSWRLHLLVAMFVSMMFCGMAMKMLLSTLFEQALRKTHVESTLFSAFCLCFYWACRTVTPLLGAGDRVFVLFGAVLALEALAYGLTPLAIAAESTWVFTVFRVLSGGGFATLTANITPLTMHMFGMRDLHVAISLTSLFEPVGGIGATVAWIIHVRDKHKGAGSYDLFMFVCSAIAGVAALFVIVLGMDDAKRRRGRQQQQQQQTPRAAAPGAASALGAAGAETAAAAAAATAVGMAVAVRQQASQAPREAQV